MNEVGAFEAKTHFSQLLADVAKGETIAITKHGKRIAILSPAEEESVIDPVAEAIKTIRTLRRGCTLGKKLTIKKLITEGRKW